MKSQNFFYYLASLVFLISSSFTSFSFAVNLKNQRKINFKVNIESLMNGDAQISVKYHKNKTDRLDINTPLRPILFTSNYSTRHERLLITKVAYIVKKNVQNFSQEITSSQNFIENTSLNTEILSRNSNLFRMRKTSNLLFFSTSFDFNFETIGFEDPNISSIGPYRTSLDFDEHLGNPNILSLQFVSDFDQYFVEGNFIGKYFSLRDDLTLVIYYQFVFVNHKQIDSKLPFFMNTVKKIKSDSKEEIAHMIDNIRRF